MDWIGVNVFETFKYKINPLQLLNEPRRDVTKETRIVLVPHKLS